MRHLIAQVRETIARYDLFPAEQAPPRGVVLGVSGGPDSLCLLHVLRTLAPEYGLQLHIGHLNHSIRGAEAEEDARFVADLCAAWGVPCTVARVDVPALARARGLALEEAARQARYRFLGDLARRLEARAVAVAHHADDQVETVLMHFLRGSGLAGLRGMRPVSWMDELRLGEEDADKPSERLRLLRPLLEVTRAEIEAYCVEQGLQPRFDRSNLDQTYFRNRLRHELIPLLKTYNPNFTEVVRRTAEVLAADYELLRAQLKETWPRVVQREADEALVLDLAVLRALPLSLQRSVLREGVHRLRRSLRNINWVHIDDALQIVARGQVGQQATLPGGLLLTLGYTEALLAPEGYTPPRQEERPRLHGGPLVVPVSGTLTLPDSPWQVTTTLIKREALPANWAHNPDPYTAYLDAARVDAPLMLRTRREGDRFSPLGLGERRQKLRDFMINVKIPRQERERVPLLVVGDEIAWVVGWRLDARYAVTLHTQRVLVVRFAR